MRSIHCSLALFSVWAVACGFREVGTAPAAATVERFFSAVASEDCDDAMSRLADSYRAELSGQGIDCTELLRQMSPYRLRDIVGVKIDARRPSAHLTYVRLEGREHEVIVRVENTEGGWKIFSM